MLTICIKLKQLVKQWTISIRKAKHLPIMLLSLFPFPFPFSHKQDQSALAACRLYKKSSSPDIQKQQEVRQIPKTIRTILLSISKIELFSSRAKGAEHLAAGILHNMAADQLIIQIKTRYLLGLRLRFSLFVFPGMFISHLAQFHFTIFSANLNMANNYSP